MKHKSISFLFAMLMSMVANVAMAYDAEIDGIYYDFKGTEATVTSGDNEYTGDVVIPETVTYNETEYSVVSIGEFAFYSCSGLTSITIPTSVKTIGNYAFSGFCGLTSVTIPNSVKTIGDYAFSRLDGLTSITIPSSVTSIGENPFAECSSLTSIGVEIGNTKYDSRSNCNAIINAETDALISGCKNTSIPNSVTSIGELAFSGCSGLTSVTIPSSVMSIGYMAFKDCSALTSVSFSNGVTSIGNYAFEGCSGLTSITIPSSVMRIKGDTFRYCDGLISIEVEEGNTIYDSRSNCNAIIETETNTLITGCRNTIIPNTVTNIGYMAFEGCSYLASITIPYSVTTIGSYAFADCTSLTDIYCYAETVPTTDANVFANNPICNAILHVPAVSIDAYKTTEPWSDFMEIVESDYLNVVELNIKAGESNTVEVGFTNSHTDFVAFQMDLTLPNGVGIDKTGCSLSDRITDENQQLTIGKLESGAYRITSTSLSLTPISGNDGILLGLKLTAEDGCIGGQATISNVIFSTAESEKVIMSDKSFDISILYNLTYIVDGEEYKTSSVAYGIALTPEAEPTKEGYTFSGWSDIPETMPNHDVTVTGTFTVNKYKMTYTVDGEEYKTYEVEYGAAIKPEAEPTKEGYTFSGWSEIPETMPAYDVTVTGTFTINKYKLTYTVDGEEYKNYEVEYGTTITPEAEPTKEGYTFSGWSEIPETMPAHDVTVTGTFGINTYKLTYMIDDAVYKVVDYKYGETITPEPAPEGNYASFEWVGLPETMPAKDVTVYANYVTGITDVVIKENIVRIYSPNGKILDKLQKGLNIVLMKDGTIKKIVVK